MAPRRKLEAVALVGQVVLGGEVHQRHKRSTLEAVKLAAAIDRALHEYCRTNVLNGVVWFFDARPAHAGEVFARRGGFDVASAAGSVLDLPLALSVARAKDLDNGHRRQRLALNLLRLLSHHRNVLNETLDSVQHNGRGSDNAERNLQRCKCGAAIAAMWRQRSDVAAISR